MDYNKIQTILDKYWNGETSIEEEKVLKQYFSGKAVDNRLEEYRPLFQHYIEAKQVGLDEQFDEQFLSKIAPTKTAKVRRLNTWIRAIAAIGLLLLGTHFLYNSYNKIEEKKGAKVIVLNDVKDAEEALEKVKAALYLVSSKMNKGANKAKVGVAKINVLDKIRK